MSARPEWQPGDVSPEARRAAESAAEAAGVPLGDWLAETVRSAVIRELGSLPAEDSAPAAAEPPHEAPERPASAEPSGNPDQPPASALQEPATLASPAAAIAPSVDDRAPRISLEAQRLAASGLTGWLATRIEGLPGGAAPVEPSAAEAAPTPATSPAAPPGPALDPASAPAEPTPSMAMPPETTVRPPLPTGPVTTLAVATLRPAPLRSRRSNDLDPAISALAGVVVVEGVREPILVRRLVGLPGSYEVVAGERRRLAAQRVSRPDLPAIIVEADDAEVLMLSLAENLGRGDFSPLDEGRAYLRLLTEFRASPSVLAGRLVRERSHIVRALRLLGLPETVRRMIDGGRLAPVQAYALLAVPDPAATAEQMIAGASPDAARDPA